MRRLRQVLIGVLLLLAGGSGVLAVRALRWRSVRVAVEPAGDLGVDAAEAAPRLAEALRFRTVSTAPGTAAIDELRALQAWLLTRFPAAHARLTREVVGEASLLYT